jgi:hypothetical protein
VLYFAAQMGFAIKRWIYSGGTPEGQFPEARYQRTRTYSIALKKSVTVRNLREARSGMEEE